MLSHHTKPIAYRRNFRWHIVPGEMLGDNYEITVDDLEGALKKQNLTLQPGDGAVAFPDQGSGRRNPDERMALAHVGSRLRRGEINPYAHDNGGSPCRILPK